MHISKRIHMPLAITTGALDPENFTRDFQMPSQFPWNYAHCHGSQILTYRYGCSQNTHLKDLVLSDKEERSFDLETTLATLGDHDL